MRLNSTEMTPPGEVTRTDCSDRRAAEHEKRAIRKTKDKKPGDFRRCMMGDKMVKVERVSLSIAETPLQKKPGIKGRTIYLLRI